MGRRVGAAVVLAGLAFAATGCGVRDRIVRTAFVDGAEYANVEGAPVTAFERHSARVYSYRVRFYRTLVVDTDEGVVIVDPMNARTAAGARTEIERRFPGKRIAAIFYSHYHPDHVRGGRELAPLAPARVVAHERCATYWKDLDTRDVLPPTEWISGDHETTIGGVRIHAIDLGRSHTDTLYAFHFPDEKLLYPPDVGFVKAWPTPGPFDTYHPGYVRAMRRLGALDFVHFVPSHGAAGTKQDFLDSAAMMEDLRATMTAAIARHDVETEEGLAGIFDEVYPAWKKRYGHLHGFDQMAALGMVRQMAGVNLGY